MNSGQRCRLCLGADAPIDACAPRLRNVLHDLFAFWIQPHDAATHICPGCLQTVDSFHTFYQQVQINQSVLNTSNDRADSVKIEVPVDIDYGSVTVKKEEDDSDDERSHAERLEETRLEEKRHSSSRKRKRSRRDDTDDDDDDGSDEYDEEDNVPLKKRASPKKKNNSSSLIKKSSSGNPTELIRDGKFIVRSKVLEKIADTFFKLQCVECKDSVEFTKLSEMMQHVIDEHQGHPFVECCNRKFFRKDYMFQHMARHLQPSAFQCPTCNKECSTLGYLKCHLGLHVPVEERLHKCDQCDKSFGHKTLLKQHLLTHVPLGQDLFKCEQCPKMFKTVQYRSDHVRTVHSYPKHLCPECGKRFQVKSQLVVHLEIHNGQRVQCQFCEVVCKNKISLREHMKRHSEIRYSCELCGYTTLKQASLKQHMITKHSNIRAHTCDVCGKQFKLKSGLKTHMVQHTGERKYACPYCPKVFAQSGNFFTHRRKMHSEEHKAKCQQQQQENNAANNAAIMAGNPQMM